LEKVLDKSESSVAKGEEKKEAMMAVKATEKVPEKEEAKDEAKEDAKKMELKAGSKTI